MCIYNLYIHIPICVGTWTPKVCISWPDSSKKGAHMATVLQILGGPRN